MSLDILSIADIIAPSAGIDPGVIGTAGAACWARTGSPTAIETTENTAMRMRKDVIVGSCI